MPGYWRDKDIMKTSPTERPWEICEWRGCDLDVGIGRKLPEYDATEWIIGPHYLPEKQLMADFRHIVKCVNAHDGLVEALIAASQDLAARHVVDKILHEKNNPLIPPLAEPDSLAQIRSVLSRLGARRGRRKFFR
jgi:hypothetical protein